MRSLILLPLLLIGVLQFGECQQLAFTKILSQFISKFDSAMETGGNIQTIWNAVAGGDSDQSQAVLSALGVVQNKLDSLSKQLSSKLDNMEDILQQLLDKGSEIRVMKRDLAVGIQSVNEADAALSHGLRNPRSMSRTALRQYVSDYFDKVNQFVEIQKRIAPTTDVGGIGLDSLPAMLAKEMNDNAKRICGQGASAQQYLMNLFMTVYQAEVKATVVLTFMGALKFGPNDGWGTYKENLIRQAKTRQDSYILHFSHALRLASREFRPCGPAKNAFFELEKFNQATVFRAPQDWLHPKYITCERRTEALNERVIRGTCIGSNLADCYDRNEEICRGTLTTCIDTKVPERCLLRGSSKRYRWIKNSYTSETWGRVQDGCKDGDVIPAESWGACVCHCISRNNRISLDLAKSRMHENRVVIAMRLARYNDIVFLQIKEGTLGPNGTISEAFDKWKPSEPSEDPEKLMVFDDINNAFNTDSLKGNHNDVLTGIQFTKAGENDKRVKLQIVVSKFHYGSGIITGVRRPISSTDSSNDFLPLGEANSANALDKPHAEDSLPGHYVRFYRSLLSEDAGQTTLPQFDSTPVESNPVTPLSGAGLLHKGVPGYAGFLALKAIGLDLSYSFDKYYLP